VPVNARTCKHLKTLLGEKYEAARVKLKNPDGPPASKSSQKKKPVSKAKTASKRKKADEEDEDEDEDESTRPGKRAKKPVSTASKPKSKAKENQDEEVDDDDDEQPTTGKSVPKLLLANKWDIDSGPDPTGWWISEKLDGVRFARDFLHHFDGKLI
jgi:DNA ligase-1